MATQVQIAALHMLAFYLKAIVTRINESQSFEQLTDVESALFFRNLTSLLKDTTHKKSFGELDKGEQVLVDHVTSLMMEWSTNSMDHQAGYLFFKLNVGGMLNYLKDKLVAQLEVSMQSEASSGQENAPILQPEKQESLDDKIRAFVEKANDHQYMIINDNCYKIFRTEMKQSDVKHSMVVVSRVGENEVPDSNVTYFLISTIILANGDSVVFTDELPKTTPTNTNSLSEGLTVVGGMLDKINMERFLKQMREANCVGMPADGGKSTAWAWKKIRSIEGNDEDPKSIILYLSSFDPFDKRVEAYPLLSLDINKLRMQVSPPIDDDVLLYWSNMLKEMIDDGITRRGYKLPVSGRLIMDIKGQKTSEDGDRLVEVYSMSGVGAAVCKLSDMLISDYGAYARPEFTK